MAQAFWTRFRILDTSGNNEALLVSASSKTEAEGKTDLACLNTPGEWATPPLGPIAFKLKGEDEADMVIRINKEMRKLIENYLKIHYPDDYPRPK
ncbi:MAG: hypothetical protein EXS48_03005 [Candidatus Staskawiczbacteria bacterium]|nr:hypothetical protein [Candidatus Staskawiczbacteria bacterium]